MTAARAAVLATLMDANFEEIADRYAEAIDNGGGLEDVIAWLRQVQEDDQ